MKKDKRYMRKNKKLLKKRFLSFILILTITLVIGLKLSLGNNILNENKVLATGIDSSIKENYDLDKQDNENIDELDKEDTEILDEEVKEKEDNINENIEDFEENQSNSTSQEVINNNYIDDVSIVIPETLYKWNFYREDNKKIAYLTFDDGPSEESTEKILDILLRNNVKATFFTLGTSIDNNKRADSILKRIIDEGHSIGNHGYSHDYRILYPNRTVDVQAFMNDIEKNDERLKSILGNDFTTRLIRMPGGHSSWNGTEELDKVLEEKGLYQMDWNALNGDAEGIEYSREELLNNLKDTVGDKDVIIVLMHDTDMKKGTVEYLQSAIDYLKENGFEFRTLK